MRTFFEFISYGSYVRVAAVDEKTGTEAIVVIPKNLSKKEMQEIALKKLEIKLVATSA